MASRRTIRTSAPRRKLIWARQPAIDLLVTGGTTSQVDLLANFETAYGAGLIGCTIMRMRGRVSTASATATTSANANLPIVVGTLVTNSLTVGGLVVGPIADPYEDWMQYDSLYNTHGSDPANGFPNLAHLEFDVKSMRKLDELGQRLLMVFASHPGAPNRNLNLTVSTLIALP